MDIMFKAIEFIFKAFEGQNRKGSNTPAVYHSIEVMTIISEMSNDNNLLCAALLHDVLEDTGINRETLVKEFGEEIVSIIDGDNEDKSLSWEERKQMTIDYVSDSASKEEKMLVLADKLSNLRSIRRNVLENGDDAFNIFNKKDPLIHYWYYSSLKEALKELDEYAVYKEYASLIDDVFGKYLERRQNEL